MLYLKNLNLIVLLATHCKFYMCMDNPKIDPSGTSMPDNSGKCQENGQHNSRNKDATSDRNNSNIDDSSSQDSDESSSQDSETIAVSTETEAYFYSIDEHKFRSKFFEIFNELSKCDNFDLQYLKAHDTVKEFLTCGRLIPPEEKDQIVDTQLFQVLSELFNLAYGIIYTISEKKGQEFKEEADKSKYKYLSSFNYIKEQTNDESSAFTTDKTKVELEKLVSTVKFSINMSKITGRARFILEFNNLNALLVKYTQDATFND